MSLNILEGTGTPREKTKDAPQDENGSFCSFTLVSTEKASIAGQTLASFQDPFLKEIQSEIRHSTRLVTQYNFPPC